MSLEILRTDPAYELDQDQLAFMDGATQYSFRLVGDITCSSCHKPCERTRRHLLFGERGKPHEQRVWCVGCCRKLAANNIASTRPFATWLRARLLEEPA